MIMVQGLIKTNPLFIQSFSLHGESTHKADSGISSNTMMKKISGRKNLWLKLYRQGVQSSGTVEYAARFQFMHNNSNPQNYWFFWTFSIILYSRNYKTQCVSN
jgi:hypothetical protein